MQDSFIGSMWGLTNRVCGGGVRGGGGGAGPEEGRGGQRRVNLCRAHDWRRKRCATKSEPKRGGLVVFSCLLEEGLPRGCAASRRRELADELSKL